MSDAAGVADYSRLVNEHSKAVYRYVMRRLSDWSSCEDVVSETFLVAWRRRDALPDRDRELAWLYAIALRVLSNQRRSRDRRERLKSRMALERGTTNFDGDDLLVDSVMKVVKRLRTDDRVLLEHVYWERLSYSEISDVLGISVNAVGIRITRAKRNLRKIIDQEGESQELSGMFSRETEA